MKQFKNNKPTFTYYKRQEIKNLTIQKNIIGLTFKD